MMSDYLQKVIDERPQIIKDMWTRGLNESELAWIEMVEYRYLGGEIDRQKATELIREVIPDYEPRAFTEEDIKSLKKIGDVIALRAYYLRKGY